MSRRDFTERDIHMALDGELPGDEYADYEAWLAANPDMAAKSRRFAVDGDMLRRAVSDVASEPIPLRMQQLLAEKKAPRRRFPSIIWRVAAAAALLAIGGLGGYFVGASGWNPVKAADSQVAVNAIEAYALYAPEKLHVVEVGADQKQHLVDWLSRRVGIPLVAPDLTAEGFDLIGGRLLPAQNQAAAQFMYQDHTGNRVSLYIVSDPTKQDTGYRWLEHGGMRALYWLDDGYGCAVAGNLSQAQLTQIADSAYKQLLQGTKS
ncbi:anti-sigma factor family protein [Pseudaminobacter soli (ex Li et al. 2025)]|uniref:Anti-sigma factor n=1 Tax=Pseudaminobacter soli (ex Li et al. 2025) TaxID=1295366 RepID=A0A2P7SFK3_9HYPH|nr:anti-sigma factor [Mesorhizobium soli]PSJ61279.1 anti-sigma factor [Mesorhizobium soli]